MTAMDEKGKIYGQGRVANHLEAVREFLTRAGMNGESAAVLEACVPGQATRNARNVLRQRMSFVRVRTMAKNRIWHLVDRYPDWALPEAELFPINQMAT